MLYFPASHPLGLCRKACYLSAGFFFSGGGMKYTKRPLTFDEQVEQMVTRGLEGDPARIRNRLQSVNYYRLTGYLYPYRIQGSDNFVPGTQFETVWEQYAFDRRLRLLVMDAIERIEIAVRAQLAYHHAHAYQDPFAYVTRPISLPDMKPEAYADFLERVDEEASRSKKDTFVEHFFTTYGDEHKYLPVWMAVEVMSFGTMQLFFRGASHRVKQNVASYFGMPDKVFDSWLHALSIVRNICAHHGRLWNKVLGVKPMIPWAKDYPDWHSPCPIPNERIFGILTICRHCLRIIAPQSRWTQCIGDLLHDFPNVSSPSMGFPKNWKDSPLWKA